MMKKKVKIFDIVLIVIFTVFSLLMIIPVYKVLVDSFDLKTAYGMKLFPEKFGFAGYKTIFTNSTMLRPFLISCYTTVMGTIMGLLLSVLGAYVLIQWKMPGRAFIANVLLFTMIFNGGMIPTYLVMKQYRQYRYGTDICIDELQSLIQREDAEYREDSECESIEQPFRCLAL